MKCWVLDHFYTDEDKPGLALSKKIIWMSVLFISKIIVGLNNSVGLIESLVALMATKNCHIS